MPLSAQQQEQVTHQSEETANLLVSMSTEEQDAVFAGCHNTIGTYTERLGKGGKGTTHYLPHNFVTQAGLQGMLLHEPCDARLMR
jgi:hypothetical protein